MLDETIQAVANKATHQTIFDGLINYLNKEGIRYVLIRGFTKLPKIPDSDLDVVIHRDDFDHVVAVMQNSKYFSNDEQIKQMKIEGSKCIYHPFFTNLKSDPEIPNGCFRLDLQNDFYFFYGPVHKNLHPNIREEIFNTSTKFKKYNVPSSEWEYILLLYRCYYDKKGKIRDGHRQRLELLKHQMAYEQKNLIEAYKKLAQTDSDAASIIKKYAKEKKLNLPAVTENCAFVFWKNPKENSAIKLFKKHVEQSTDTCSIITSIQVNLGNTKQERLKLINSIYEIKVQSTDPRVLMQNDCTVYIVKNQSPKYKNIGKRAKPRTFRKVVNKDMFRLKRKIRESFTYEDIHGSDEANESNKVFANYGLNKYINEYVYVPLELTRAVIWRDETTIGKYDLVKIQNTPHYAYIKNNKQPYIDYTKKIDKVHSQQKFEDLLQRFEPLKVFENFTPRCYIMSNGYFLIYDGLHRLSILHHMGYKYARVKLVLPGEKNVYIKEKFENIEI